MTHARPPSKRNGKNTNARNARALEIGPDGRKVYTKDRDARAGKRSATNRRAAGLYVGRELHIGVAVPRIGKTDTTAHVSFAPAVPRVIMFADPVPAGSHRGKTVMPHIVAAHRDGFCEDVVADAGYTLMSDHFLLPLQEAGIPVTLRPKSFQLRTGDTIGGAPVILGQLFSPHVPNVLVDLALPGRNATADERARSASKFDQRACFRFSRHKGPGADGTTRWRCPYCAGRVRSRTIGKSMRRPRTAPRYDLPRGVACCDRILLVGAGALPMMQPTIVGTTAWWEVWGRRNIVETVNSQLHGGFVEIDKGYVHLLHSDRIEVALAHTLAGYNRHEIKQFMRVNRLLDADHPEALPPERKKRRPRRNRVARFADLSPHTRPPPAS
jgi:hypothetical protein